MKGKKYKRGKSNMHALYERYFGVRQPYQVLVDAKFCEDTLKWKLPLAEKMPEILGGGHVKLMTTPCIMEELRKCDARAQAQGLPGGALFVAKRFEQRHCKHDRLKSAEDCIRDLILTDQNPQHYCVASQDYELRRSLHACPGVPIVFITKGIIAMEAPTKRTLEEARRREAEKLLKPALIDKQVIAKQMKDAGETGASVEAADPPVKKRKKKSPNPLSCLKKKDKPTQGSESACTKKKRKRRPKKKNA